MKFRLCTGALLIAGLVSAASLSVADAASSSGGWEWGASIYGLAAGMSGDVTAKGIDADLNVGFGTILGHLKFGAMGKVRAIRGDWSVTADVIYMNLGASKGGVSADLTQWVIEPTLGHRLNDRFEVLAGARYNSIDGEVRGPGVLPTPRILTGTQDWWDAIVGFNYRQPLVQDLAFDLRADIGGGGSDLTWQFFPSVTWQFSGAGAMHVGYRWVYTDYETGSGLSRFRYDVITQGPQVGTDLDF